MTLSALIRKGGLQQVATAIPATFATEEENKAGMVARIATVAVANSLDNITLPACITPEQIEQAARELEIDLTDPVMSKGLVEMLTDKHYLDKGQVPPSYTSTTFCRGCKTTVPIFVGCPETVEACPWCHRRWELSTTNVPQSASLAAMFRE